MYLMRFSLEIYMYLFKIANIFLLDNSSLRFENSSILFDTVREGSSIYLSPFDIVPKMSSKVSVRIRNIIQNC